MVENHRPSYVGLVAALRAEFTPIQLESLKATLDEHRYGSGSASMLYRAVADAWDIRYDAGESVHPAVREFLDRARGGESPWVLPPVASTT